MTAWIAGAEIKGVVFIDSMVPDLQTLLGAWRRRARLRARHESGWSRADRRDPRLQPSHGRRLDRGRRAWRLGLDQRRHHGAERHRPRCPRRRAEDDRCRGGAGRLARPLQLRTRPPARRVAPSSPTYRRRPTSLSTPPLTQSKDGVGVRIGRWDAVAGAHTGGTGMASIAVASAPTIARRLPPKTGRSAPRPRSPRSLPSCRSRPRRRQPTRERSRPPPPVSYGSTTTISWAIPEWAGTDGHTPMSVIRTRTMLPTSSLQSSEAQMATHRRRTLLCFNPFKHRSRHGQRPLLRPRQRWGQDTIGSAERQQRDDLRRQHQHRQPPVVSRDRQLPER